MQNPSAAFDRRSAGVLLHVTSLPGPHGSGDLSSEARRFVDQLAAAGQTWWQLLPINPPGPLPGCSPYSSGSIHAGAEILIDLEQLRRDGLLKKSDFTEVPKFDDRRVDFDKVVRFRERLLRQAHARFVGLTRADHAAYNDFISEHADWLEDEVLFNALKHYFGGARWFRWPAELRDRQPAALKEIRAHLTDELSFHRFVQFQFDKQWSALRAYANQRGVKLIGDVPIFVSHDSVPVWCQPKLWQLDRDLMPKAISGYPPDFFSKDGQCWGHPQYAWAEHAKDKFNWWIDRFATMFRWFDAVRIDHFLGFSRLWSIPTHKTAAQGKWVKTPGDEVLTALRNVFGPLAVIAEDLGQLTPEAIALRDKHGLPGMRIFQFGFGVDSEDDCYHRPHEYPKHSVAYTGTHDNDTIAGFLASSRPAERERILRYTGGTKNWDAVRSVFASAANTAIVPLQDLLNSKQRMNTPGVAEGNWDWRYRRAELTDEVLKKMRTLSETTDRTPRLAKRASGVASGSKRSASSKKSKNQRIKEEKNH